MKKLVAVCLIGFCFPSAFAQKGKVIKAGAEALRGGTSLTEAVTRQVAKQTVKIPEVRSAQSLPSYQLVPLKMTAAVPSVPTALAVPLASSQPQTAIGTPILTNYCWYQTEDKMFESFVSQINPPDQTGFLYRGMHVNDFNEVVHILSDGLETEKTGYNNIYMSSNVAVARHFAKLEEGIPVVVAMEQKNLTAPFLRQTYGGEFYYEKDIPSKALSHVFVFLDINGTPAWHRVTWQDKLVFTPISDDPVTPAAQPYIQITNTPGNPTVKLGGNVDNMPAMLPARMLRGADTDYIIRPTNDIGAYTGELFVPQNVAENGASFYRGMRLENLDDLKNLLINGLEVNKTNYSGEIYASLSVSLTLYHATLGDRTNLPTLIKIPATQTLRSYAPEAFPTEDRYAPRAFQTGEQAVFRRDVPARFISDVWVFLEVNGQPDWYKATLENDELVFLPAHGELREIPPATQRQVEPHIPMHFTNFANSVPMVMASPAFSAKATHDMQTASATLLKPSQVYHGVSDEARSKLYLPFFVNSEEPALYRGMVLYSIGKLKNILINGLQIKQIYHGAIFTTNRPGIALWYMGMENTKLPIDMDQLFEESDRNKGIPVLVRIPTTPQLLNTNPPEEHNHEGIFHKKIPAKMLEVFVFTEIADLTGWYQVTLGANQELVFTWVESKEMPGQIDWK